MKLYEVTIINRDTGYVVSTHADLLYKDYATAENYINDMKEHMLKENINIDNYSFQISMRYAV